MRDILPLPLSLLLLRITMKWWCKIYSSNGMFVQDLKLHKPHNYLKSQPSQFPICKNTFSICIIFANVRFPISFFALRDLWAETESWIGLEDTKNYYSWFWGTAGDAVFLPSSAMKIFFRKEMLKRGEASHHNLH